MKLIDVLSLIGGLMTSSAPLIQAYKTFRTRDITGLSLPSYLLMLCTGSLAVLIGVQYQVLSLTIMAAIALLGNVMTTFMISRVALLILLLVTGATGLACQYAAPTFFPTLLTTRWAEQVAFIYGLVAAGTFLPQVLKTRRTRRVSSLSLFNLLFMVVGLIVWTMVSILLGNYSLIGWNVVIILMMAELLRIKVVAERKGASATPMNAPVPPSRVV